jgi:hypothetical protein
MGVEAFDIQLHNYRSSMMDAPLKIAKNVPMARLTTGYRNFGGSIDIDLSDSSLRAGSGYVIAFVESLQGQVYSTSPVFSIVKEAPQNYTATPSGVAAPTVTATITAAPEAQDTWPITMDGKGATLSISYGS